MLKFINKFEFGNTENEGREHSLIQKSLFQIMRKNRSYLIDGFFNSNSIVFSHKMGGKYYVSRYHNGKISTFDIDGKETSLEDAAEYLSSIENTGELILQPWDVMKLHQRKFPQEKKQLPGVWYTVVGKSYVQGETPNISEFL